MGTCPWVVVRVVKEVWSCQQTFHLVGIYPGCQGEATTGLAKDIAESDALRRKLRAVLHPDKIADPNELRVANAVRSALGL